MEKNRVKSSDIKELRARKRVLKQEMKEIQQEIEGSLAQVRHSVIDRASPRFWVEKYPLQLVGSALVAGFLIARKTGYGRMAGLLSPGLFSGLLASELKRLVAQRAVRYIIQRIEGAIDERKEKEL